MDLLHADHAIQCVVLPGCRGLCPGQEMLAKMVKDGNFVTHTGHHPPDMRHKIDSGLRPDPESSVFCQGLHCQAAQAHSVADIFLEIAPD